MATRWRLTDGRRQWVIDVDGDLMSVDAEQALTVEHTGDGRFSAKDRATEVVGAATVDGERVWVTIAGHVFVFRIQPEGAGRPTTPTSGHDALGAPMPATVIRVAVQPGQAVQQGEILLALEAMKMELFIRAPRAGVVRRINCQAGDLVSPGTMLVEMDMETAHDGA